MAGSRVLIIDDELEVGRLVASVAQACGYAAEAVVGAVEFRQRFASWKPSHIVLDLHMPEVDGIEILRFLAEKRCLARIVIMSGSDEKILEAARHLGVERGLDIAATVRKPFRAAALRDVFAEVATSEPDVVDGAALEAAIDRDQFVLFYQPKVTMAAVPGSDRLRTRPVGFEALLRWQHPTRGLVGPQEVIPVAEALGMMDRVTDKVFDLALAQSRRWMDEGLDLTVAVNVSGQNLHSADFTDRLTARCRAAGVEPSRLVIELTESAAMHDPATAMDSLTRLRLKGFMLAIDDFGTGYSSLVQLQRLPFSELKIDHAFVADADRSAQTRVILKTMIDLAQNLGLTAVAEGVENERILRIVHDFGCDLAQGYHIARPMPSDQVGDWLRKSSGQ